MRNPPDELPHPPFSGICDKCNSRDIYKLKYNRKEHRVSGLCFAHTPSHLVDWREKYVSEYMKAHPEFGHKPLDDAERKDQIDMAKEVALKKIPRVKAKRKVEYNEKEVLSNVGTTPVDEVDVTELEKELEQRRTN